jgi:ACR3 family arsenite efflux pump ArsB
MSFFFDCHLTLWVAICMASAALGKAAPGAVAALRGLEFGRSQINIPIGCADLLMVYLDDAQGRLRRSSTRAGTRRGLS